MDSEDIDVAIDGDFAVNLSAVSCSICLETVSDNGDRSYAKLLCGHRFHLDCIGSAFNVKGAMQCPNCRKIEKGQWLYAHGGRAIHEFNIDDWAHDDDLHDFNYSEMSFGVHWCPFNGLTRLPTSFNEVEFSSTGYHDLLGQHAISMEHTSVSSSSHPCPYVAYVSPLNLSSSIMGNGISDGSNFSGHWIENEAPTSFALPSVDVQYHMWDHPSPHFLATSNRSGVVEQTSIPSMSLRPSLPSADIPRSVSFMQPLQVGLSSSARASSMTPPYPGSNARARDRVQALQAYYQRPNTPSSRTPIVSGSSRRVSHEGSSQVGPTPPQPHQLSGFQYGPSSASSSWNYMEAENHMPRGFHVWEMDQIEREPIWGTAFHHPNAPDTGVRFNGYHQWRASGHASEHTA